MLLEGDIGLSQEGQVLVDGSVAVLEDARGVANCELVCWDRGAVLWEDEGGQEHRGDVVRE